MLQPFVALVQNIPDKTPPMGLPQRRQRRIESHIGRSVLLPKRLRALVMIAELKLTLKPPRGGTMENIWTSLVKVSGTKDSLILHGHADAYVWVVAEAPNVDEYKQSVEGAFRELELTLLSFEEIRTSDEVEAAEDDSDELQALISTVRNRQQHIAYGSFYRFTDGHV